MNQLNSASSLRAQLNSTPIKSRGLLSQQTVNRNKCKTQRNNSETTVLLPFGSANRYDEASPPKLKNTQKLVQRLMITPIKKEPCINHSSKDAEYQIQIDGDLLYYCEKCSAMLASQGFQVNKMHKRANLSDQSTGGGRSSFQENPERYNQIQSFCKKAKQTLKGYDSNIQLFSSLGNHYQQQQMLINEFHQGMITILESIRDEHLRMLKTQSKKYLQIADIQRAQAEDNATQIEDILEDIEENLADIVSSLSEERYREVMNCYQNKISLFGHQVQELREDFDGITSLTRSELEDKLKEFNRVISEFFSTEEDTCRNIPLKQNSIVRPKLCAENMKIVKLAKMTNSKGPFRNLFVEGDLQSPAFKPM